jgi:hypothetical protein
VTGDGHGYKTYKGVDVPDLHTRELVERPLGVRGLTREQREEEERQGYVWLESVDMEKLLD